MMLKDIVWLVYAQFIPRPYLRMHMCTIVTSFCLRYILIMCVVATAFAMALIHLNFVNSESEYLQHSNATQKQENQ